MWLVLFKGEDKGCEEGNWEMLGFIASVLITWGHNFASWVHKVNRKQRLTASLPFPSLYNISGQQTLQHMSPNILLGRMLQLFSFCEFLNTKPVCMLLQHVSWKSAIHKGQAQLWAELWEWEQQKGTPPCQLLHLLQAYANRPNKSQQHWPQSQNKSIFYEEGGRGEGRIWTRKECAVYGETYIVQHTLRILPLSTPRFSDSLNLPICIMFNFRELQSGTREKVHSQQKG